MSCNVLVVQLRHRLPYDVDFGSGSCTKGEVVVDSVTKTRVPSTVGWRWRVKKTCNASNRRRSGPLMGRGVLGVKECCCFTPFLTKKEIYSGEHLKRRGVNFSMKLPLIIIS